MKIENARSVNNQFIKAVVYGQSGAGKTTLAKTLAKYKPIILSLEGGLLSIAGEDIDVIDMTQDDAGNVIPMHLRSARITEAYQYLQAKEAREKYKTVFIDSITEIGQAVHAAALKEFPERNQALPMWGEYGNRMKNLIRAFRDLPGYHVVFTCLSKIEKDEAGKRFAAFDLSGSIADRMPGFFDLVAYLRVNEEGGRELLCAPTESVLAKDRSGKLAKIEPANLETVFAKILGGK